MGIFSYVTKEGESRILNNEQLRERAYAFALTQELTSTNRFPTRKWAAFRSDLASLHEFAKDLRNTKVECKQPAEDWLLDHINFIEIQAQVVFKELPRATLKILPKLRSTGIPRIYALCNDYLEHVDGRYDLHSFESYIMSFQEVSVLKDIECWTLPSAMRVIIIRRLSEVMREVRKRHDACHSILSLIEQIGSRNMSDTKIRSLLEQETRNEPLNPIKIVHFVQHLSEREPNIRIVHDWLSAHVENSEFSLEQMVSYEHQLQAELQVTCGNLVQSLHILERLPWRLTFSRVSYLEQALLSDSKNDYKRLDIESRDLLRGRVVKIANQLNVPETLVAETSVRLAASCHENPEQTMNNPRGACLAYYLFDPKGITFMRKELCKVARPRVLPQLAIQRQPSIAYFLSSILLFAGLMLLTGICVANGMAVRPLSWLAIIIALILPVSDWVIEIIHAVIGKCCRPTPLLRYDFSEHLPDDAVTMVVMPVIWSSLEEVDDVVNQLLIHYLANRQQNIHFAILADFYDAATETMPDDEKIIAYAGERINELRKKYGSEKFFLFHRSRIYNSVDQNYMGWERKRGKLVEFVELLAGSDQTSYTTCLGQTEILKKIRYIFTTDSDTQLPIGVVSRLAGSIHFPFNRPRLNDEGTRVIEGFGLLQPRIGVSYESTQKSRFASLWAGEPGIDPYAFAVSNVYQDLFGHAIFVGKGIFDVEAFRKTLVNRIPENSVLSHDLLEGGFLRTGLTSDIEVVESYPGIYYAYERRAHRWIRGDWQLIKWLGLRCNDRQGESRVALCSLTRWQIVDNLRRSLRAPVFLIIAILGLFALPGRNWIWETIIGLTVFLPFLSSLISALLGRRLNRTLCISFLQCTMQLITLPFTTVLSFDAILRTLYRMFVSRRNLLEWVPSSQTDREDTRRRVFLFEPAGYMVIFIFALIAWFSGGLFERIFGTAALIFWLLARPVITQLNQPPKAESRTWINNAHSELNELAFQIWSFYEKYVTEEESWLPPDNVQYHPKEIIAHRTSPTNIGLYLACVVAARDLEFIDTPTMLNRIESSLKTIIRLEKWNGHLLNWYDTCSASPLLPKYVSTVDSGNFVGYLMVVEQSLLEWSLREIDFQTRIKDIISEIDQLIQETNFKALFNSDERLFSLGYHIDTNQKDTILYDLLASEARQASFVAIALGQIPASHWFSLGRTMTISGQHKTLLSWSGTMFEYLMPSLIMRSYRNTIWDSTYRGVVHAQRTYADQYQLPFGISESGYYAFDYQLNYQYRAFGVPRLGLDRGLEQNLVLAPYATIMALPYAGEAGLAALRKFEDYRAKSEFGYYEAVDFTAQRLLNGDRFQVVQSYMAHHQGMSMLTLTNLLSDDIMIRRFHSDARVRTCNLLLQERLPEKAALIEEPLGLNAKFTSFDEHFDNMERSFTKPTLVPEINVLSNSRMTTINTNHGTGMITWNGLSISRWREDPIADTSGMMIYVHEIPSEKTWSITSFPCNKIQDPSSVFRLDKTTYEGTYRDISSKLEITIPPDIDAEVRRLQLVNNSTEEKILEVTTFLELALASPLAFSAHPAFNKLFIDTSHDAQAQCLLAKRRTREDEEQETWAVHTVYTDDPNAHDYEFETDRAKFIGRGYSLKEPYAISSRLRELVGSVVDPAFIMRRRIHLAPRQSASIYIVTGVANSREKALDIVQQLREPNQVDRTFHLALVRSQIDLRHLHLTPKQASAAHRLAGRLLYTPSLTPMRSEAIKQNSLGQSALWSHGISGDVPIAIVSIKHSADLPFVSLLAQQHQYLCQLGLEIDLVVLDETVGGYQDQLMNRLRDQLAGRGLGQLRRIIGLKASQLDEKIVTLLKSVARVWLRAGGPSLSAQLSVYENPIISVQQQLVVERKWDRLEQPSSLSPIGEFFNGWGGFIEGGNAYQMYVQKSSYLPRPWSNILANPRFGCLITDFGTGYSWWNNSRECKLTPWTNDPVLDEPGECLYLQDLDSKRVWSATPKPAGDELTYKVTHGKGFSRFEQLDGDVVHKMDTIVPLNDTLKLIKLNLSNRSNTQKRISISYYAEWVIGVIREAQAPYIVTEWDEDHKALLARNAYQDTFRNAVSFMHISVPNSSKKADNLYSWTGDREEFIGRSGTYEFPSAFLGKGLSKRTGAFSNSCGVLQTVVEIPPDEEITVLILFGCESSKDKVSSLIKQYGRPSAFEDTLSEVTHYWQKILGQVQIKTPDRAMDIMMNGWLLYQTLACRLWARTAFYQAGGAFGFRDQLQDSLALLHADPKITRKQILINAAHQYQEGDVQHWWHQETDKGIRTKFSDDLLWLPYAVSRYLEQTGDYSILKEIVPYLRSEVLKEDELERYEDTVVSEENGSLLDHCLRAIHHALKFGEHGCPLMGIGDWNDGMSRIGAKGRGESIWLGWFLIDILNRYSSLEDGILPADKVVYFNNTAKQLEENLNQHAWDGSWFRRAYTDAGTWIGSNNNTECKIDAIAQSWSVISQGTPIDRQIQAMTSFDRELVDRDLNLARLLTKPFDKTKPSPGYIQGYPPGIRENGGQYTHGVIWGIVAWSMLNRRDKAFELFSILNPINHTLNTRDVLTYENEPYAMSADVYTAHPHQGRGGWSWYTGASSWMYQAGLEYILGVKLQGDQLYIKPCVPTDWESFSIDYIFGKTTYSLVIHYNHDSDTPVKWIVNDKDASDQPYLKLLDDGQVHHVKVYLALQPLSTIS
ncbi:GH36-type glycosyl hydrolase domain-containing protein [Neobacillus cucumis]|uniref:GH36-type glycosyl hydrolase domain-containing protein n=1 Tax=Neobacillus cucumis TaxID=1740721 RepID=UPI002E23F2D0|nr:glucoamylase family protein [Neobacillus cucumis]